MGRVIALKIPTNPLDLSGDQIHGILEVYELPHKRATELISRAQRYCHDHSLSPNEFVDFVSKVTLTLISIGMSRGWDRGKTEADDHHE